MLIDTLQAAFRSIENPAVPLSQAGEELWDALGGGGNSSAGVAVSRETALTYSAIWRGVNVVGRDVAKLPLHVYRREGRDDRQRATDHPAYRLLRRRPNAEMTAFTFKQTLMGHVLLAGNAYVYIARNGAGDPVELIPLLPDRTYPARIDGRLWYLTIIEHETRTLPAGDVLHLKGFSHDGLVGYNVIQKAKESIGWSLAMRKYSATFFRNGARASGVLMTPGAMDETSAKNLLSSWNEKNAGLDNAHKTILLEEGVKYTPNTIKQDEAQFLESMQFSLMDVANWFGVAPHKVGHPSRTSYNSLQEENQAHLDEAIDPWCVAWEEECNEKLLREHEKEADSHYCEFNREALIRVDFKSKIEARAKQIESGELSPDEARAMQNLPPRPDGLGGRFVLPKNMQFADQAAAEANDAAAGQRVAEALRDLLEEAGSRAASRLANEARRAAKRPARFLAWLDDLAELRGVLVAILAPAIGVASAVRGGDAARATTGLVDALLSTCREELLDVAGRATAAELPAALEHHLAGSLAFAPGRVAALARTCFDSHDFTKGTPDESHAP